MMPEFDAFEFLRRFDAGELDSNLAQEIEDLSADQMEQLALVLASKLRRNGVRAN
jgi:hypothetical protein